MLRTYQFLDLGIPIPSLAISTLGTYTYCRHLSSTLVRRDVGRTHVDITCNHVAGVDRAIVCIR